MTPSGTRGVVNDALSIYFADATMASAFVARSCDGATKENRGAEVNSPSMPFGAYSSGIPSLEVRS